jgi:hypothetical protein
VREVLSRLKLHLMAQVPLALHGIRIHARWWRLHLCDAQLIYLNDELRIICSPDHQVHEAI